MNTPLDPPVHPDIVSGKIPCIPSAMEPLMKELTAAALPFPNKISNVLASCVAPDVKRAAGDLKCPMHLLPPEFLRRTAEVLGHGATKYGPWNFRASGVKLDTYVAAIMRHLTSMAEGEWLDQDSGKPHAAHIAASCAILIDCDHVGMLEAKDGPVPEQKEGAAP